MSTFGQILDSYRTLVGLPEEHPLVIPPGFEESVRRLKEEGWLEEDPTQHTYKCGIQRSTAHDLKKALLPPYSISPSSFPPSPSSISSSWYSNIRSFTYSDPGISNRRLHSLPALSFFGILLPHSFWRSGGKCTHSTSPRFHFIIFL